MSPEEVLVKHKVQYLPRGGDLEVRCFNPEHEDRNPSMKIDKITGVFNCLSCGFKGNVFAFFGLKVNVLDTQRLRLKEKITNKRSETVGHDLPETAVPFARPWRNISPETYTRFGAFTDSGKSFIGRVVFPIRSISGKIVGFNGRHQTPGHDPKYLIVPPKAKLPLFPAKPDEIYDGRIILVEGIFDMLNLYDKGLKNAVCVFGTQKLAGKDSASAREKLNLLRFTGVTGIDIFFDPDDAGQNAAEVVKTLCESMDFNVRNIRYPKDPGELTAPQVLKLKEKLYGEDRSSRDEAE